MTLNAKKLPKAAGGKRPDPLEPGSYPARLVQLIVLGIQKERPYKGEEKAPRLNVYLTYEFLDEFLKDEDGNDQEDKPRWLSEQIPFLSLSADKAKSTKRYFALDPDDKADGDWSQLVGAPCVVTVVNEADKRPGMDRIYEKISAVSAMRPKEAAKAAELKNAPKIFDFYDPDIDVFNALPDWLQEKIQSAVDYEGSKLEKLLGKAPKEDKPKPSLKEELEDEIPFDQEVEQEEDW